MTKKEYLESYINFGFKIVPIKENSKQPVGYKWNSYWLHNQDKLLQCLDENPNINFGLLLGEIIDVEADSEAANQKLDKLIGTYEHPVYMSKKSKHHLFKTPDKRLRKVVHKQIEFRGFGHQSLLPPSTIDGITYKWIHACNVPEMPPILLNYYKSVRIHKKDPRVEAWEDHVSFRDRIRAYKNK